MTIFGALNMTAMKKIILLLLVLMLGVAALTKPDEKTCIIEGVRAVWGKLMPDVETRAPYFEQFMNVHSVNVVVKDWFFFKQVKYKIGSEQKTVAVGAFNHVFHLVSPIEDRSFIPPMPKK